MKKKPFISTFLSPAREAGKEFRLNPVVILAQSALESGWGQSRLAQRYHNFFGITAYGQPSRFWNGEAAMLGKNSLQFRVYDTPRDSFLDYARLIRAAYPKAAELTHDPVAFARAISASKYISEVNGDNREAYCVALSRLCSQIAPMIKAATPATLSPSGPEDPELPTPTNHSSLTT